MKSLILVALLSQGCAITQVNLTKRKCPTFTAHLADFAVGSMFLGFGAVNYAFGYNRDAAANVILASTFFVSSNFAERQCAR